MATITGLTAERMLEIEGATVVGGHMAGDHLILEKFDGTTVDTGALPPGPQGPPGPSGGQIPGEIRMWPGSALPAIANYGKWVWADGATYDVATYPKAAANIATQWRTFGGASDPPASLFRVPDLRGLIPAGMDAMPAGARANRLTRSVSIVIAGKTGEEIHAITVPEMAAHGHTVTDPGHGPNHGSGSGGTGNQVQALPGYTGTFNGRQVPAFGFGTEYTGISIAAAGGGQAHENMQPTVFIPYIVKMDD